MNPAHPAPATDAEHTTPQAPSALSPTDPAAVRPLAERVRAAARTLAPLALATRNAALSRIADTLESNTARILAANARDLALAQNLVAAGDLTPANFARLPLSPAKLAEMAAQVRAVQLLPDPLGRTLDAIQLDHGLDLEKRSVPLGVLAVIFEARPDAVTQIAALALKSGNAVLLKPGREVEHTAHALVSLIRDAIANTPQPAPGSATASRTVISTEGDAQQRRSEETCGSIATNARGTTVLSTKDEATQSRNEDIETTLPADAVQLITGRAAVAELLTLSSLVDLVIPRGSRALVEHIQATTRIPVLGHADGICHIYVDQHADLAQALAIVDDAKTDYPAVCNAAETCLVHEAIAPTFLPALLTRLRAKGVHFRADQPVRDLLASSIGNTAENLSPTDLTDPDSWHTEYGDLTLALRIVPSLTAAIAHIHQHGSAHTETICTTDPVAAEQFLNQVDAASVMLNASTRFADGFRYGLGAEVGVSTSRIHARGPVGLEGLTTTRFVLRGHGHLAGDYRGPNARPFTHTRLRRIP